MAGNKTRFDAFLTEEINRLKGITVPIKANLFERIFIHKTPWKKVHPNPNDEFCDPKIGPNYGIISRYEDTIRNAMKHAQRDFIEEALIVEKIHPEGYMILNGHHRWAAAIRMNIARIPVRIVNLTQTSDIREMLRNARHNKRVTLDLDEVVFQPDAGHAAEKALAFPFNKLYRERLRRGIPALFHYIKTKGYDIWVYSANYYSPEYIKKLFRHYRVRIDGIVTGTAKNTQAPETEKKKLETMIAQKYPQTLHIDGHSLLRINSITKEFEEFPLTGDPFTWSQEAIGIVGEMEKHA